MAMEPITLYSARPDLKEVLAQLRAWDLEVERTGTEDDWRDAKVVLDYEGQPGPLALTFRRDPSYCAEPNWSRQLQGMQDYFRRFPQVPRKDEVIRHLGKLHSALATIWMPDMITDQRDERIGLLCAVAQLFDCVLFSPSLLRDASGKVLLSSDGEVDSDAQLPPAG
jgi:hypothetical protein